MKAKYEPVAVKLFIPDNYARFPARGYLALNIVQSNSDYVVLHGELSKSEISIGEKLNSGPIRDFEMRISGGYHPIPIDLSLTEIAEKEIEHLGDFSKYFFVIVDGRMYKSAEQPAKIR